MRGRIESKGCIGTIYSGKMRPALLVALMVGRFTHAAPPAFPAASWTSVVAMSTTIVTNGNLPAGTVPFVTTQHTWNEVQRQDGRCTIDLRISSASSDAITRTSCKDTGDRAICASESTTLAGGHCLQLNVTQSPALLPRRQLEACNPWAAHQLP